MALEAVNNTQQSSSVVEMVTTGKTENTGNMGSLNVKLHGPSDRGGSSSFWDTLCKIASFVTKEFSHLKDFWEIIK